ncbi:hypothetical protein EDD16DRAFT_1898714 [Pisolithus croceorrhizus]|nr:hypothetical protein EDD16DRAFT_1898714 [Pisolithus croceorrhizus]
MSLPETATSMSGAFDSIPIIDVGHASTHEERVALAQQIRDACMNVGFFYITNHGIPEETINNILSAMQAYFNLPVETKVELYHRQGGHYRGYGPLFDSNIDPANRGDLYESFVIGWEERLRREDDDKKADNNPTTTENPWPSEPAGFREAFTNYYQAAFDVGKFLHHLFALALDLPESYFDDKLKRSATMRGLHYPPQTGPEDDRIMGIGAHADFECFTILWQEPGIQALQILNSKNQWINVAPIPGTLVINIGDMLSRWTNDVFRSTVHRAINRSGVRRYSIALFIGVDAHVDVEVCEPSIHATGLGTLTFSSPYRVAYPLTDQLSTRSSMHGSTSESACGRCTSKILAPLMVCNKSF